MGFRYVYDTCFGADLTIMEEANEFLEKFKNGKTKKFPLFTSCCPGWVRFLKGKFPELTDRLSTSKSPQQMFGAIAKTWLAKKPGNGAGKTLSRFHHALPLPKSRMRPSHDADPAW